MVSFVLERSQMVRKTLDVNLLRRIFGDRLHEGVELAKYSSVRIGGPADVLLVAESADDLAEITDQLWLLETPYVILGGGSNVLISDDGVRGIVIINRARQIRFDTRAIPASVWAESGANFGLIARQAGRRGLSGMEWAVGIPGTLGGAIVGNAGAHGADIATNLLVAEILHHRVGNGRQSIRGTWTQEELEFTYRSSKIKREPGKMVVLSARLQLHTSSREAVQHKIDEFSAYRRRTQPTGASVGSMFKNPPDDFAGRLIDRAGLKGTRIGDAEISSVHANFFINHGDARAEDVMRLIDLAREKVMHKTGVILELEIELLGDWENQDLD